MYFQDYTSDEINKFIEEKASVILPLGAVEAHGAHLPLGFDNEMALEYTKRLAKRTDSLLLPLIPYGQVWSARNYPGSITISNSTLTNLLIEISESVYKQGVKLISFVSGHLGNMVAMKEASRLLYGKYKDLKTLYLFYPGIHGYAEDVREGSKSHGTYIHADEIETSIGLYLKPNIVNMQLAINEDIKVPVHADITPTPWDEFSKTAVLGDAKLASYEKGEYIVNNTLEDAVNFINSFK